MARARRTILVLVVSLAGVLVIIANYPKGVSDGVRGEATIRCSDKPLASRVKQRGSFYVLTNFVMAEASFRCDESVTYVAPADYRFLDNLEPLLERWRGPVSVALYAPGYDFRTTVESISYLRRCGSPLVRKFVSFHLFFESEHSPEEVSLVEFEGACAEDPPFLNATQSYKKENKLLYPINVARNVAKEEAQTHFVLASDVELFPTPNLIPRFLDLVKRKPELFIPQQRQVFVLPLFEIPEGETVPRDKTKLQDMFKNQKAFVFHKKLCQMCHKVPLGDDWIKLEEAGELDVFTVGKREGKHKFWEPFYIGTKDEPDFDERLTWEGQSNKMTQGYLMCVLDYKYLVLNDAFLVHKPGIKKAKKQLKEHGKVVGQTNKLKKVIISEYDRLYGKRESCRL